MNEKIPMTNAVLITIKSVQNNWRLGATNIPLPFLPADSHRGTDKT